MKKWDNMPLKELFLKENEEYYMQFFEENKKSKVVSDEDVLRLIMQVENNDALFMALVAEELVYKKVQRELLMYCVRKSEYFCFRYLLNHGIDFSYENHYLLRYSLIKRNFEIIRELNKRYIGLGTNVFKIISDILQKYPSKETHDLMKILIEEY